MPILALAVLLAAQAPIESADPDNQTRVTVSYADLNLDLRRDVDKLLRRLNNAALEACGASSFSLKEVRLAVRRSACWQQAMTAAVRRLNHPAISAAFSLRAAY